MILGACSRTRRPKPERNLRRTAFWLAVTGVSLYLVAPSLIEVLSSWDDLDDVEPWWFAGMVILQALGLACLWYVQRVALHTVDWVPVIYSQLAGNALSKIAPAGGAVGRRPPVPDAGRGGGARGAASPPRSPPSTS